MLYQSLVLPSSGSLYLPLRSTACELEGGLGTMALGVVVARRFASTVLGALFPSVFGAIRGQRACRCGLMEQSRHGCHHGNALAACHLPGANRAPLHTPHGKLPYICPDVSQHRCAHSSAAAMPYPGNEHTTVAPPFPLHTRHLARRRPLGTSWSPVIGSNVGVAANLTWHLQ